MEDGTRSASPPHGQKRQPEDGLENEQRLAKRFNLLKIDHNGKLQLPTPPPVRRSRSNAFSDSMELDDTRNRIYIHNIDDELSDMESEEEKLVFLPDIEKRLTRIPRSILTGRQSPPPNSEIVLYNVPESLSIPKEQDKVRKAIIETRERARDRQSLGLHCTNQATTNGQEGSSAGADSHFDVPAANGFEQQDAMDIG